MHAGYVDKEPPLNDAEPRWESLGYRRDLLRHPPQLVHSTPPVPDALQTRQLPRIDNPNGEQERDIWNIEECKSGLWCNDPACNKFHHVVERRCRKFVLLGKNGCRSRDGRCASGLHVKAADVCQIYKLNLETSEAHLLEASQQPEAKSPDDRATYIRIVVWNFAAVRMRALKCFLEKLPLVHELLLPDRDFCPFHLLTMIELMNRHLYQKCPKLRWLVFGDGTAETVHNAGAPRNQAKTPQSPVSREPVHPLQDYDPWSTGDTDKWPCWNTKNKWNWQSDWWCQSCGTDNFASRSECRYCSKPQINQEIGIVHMCDPHQSASSIA